MIDEGGQDGTNARIGPFAAAKADDAMSLASVLVDDRAVALVMLVWREAWMRVPGRFYTQRQ